MNEGNERFFTAIINTFGELNIRKKGVNVLVVFVMLATTCLVVMND